MPDTTYDVICGKKFAHGGMRSLQPWDHLTGFNFFQQLLQVTVKYDGIVLHDSHTFPLGMGGDSFLLNFYCGNTSNGMNHLISPGDVKQGAPNPFISYQRLSLLQFFSLYLNNIIINYKERLYRKIINIDIHTIHEHQFAI
jgi:hypothetical protein